MQNLKSNLVVAILLAVLCFLVYSNSLNNGFMVDDHSLLLGNTRANNLNFLGEYFIPEKQVGSYVEGGGSYYRPLAHLIPAVAYRLFGDNRIGHHLFNLFLFYVDCLVLYFFLMAIFGNRELSVMTAFLYVAHPINSLMINYLTANVFAVQLIAMKISIISVLLYEEKKRSGLYYLSILFFLVSLLCHEVSVTFPFYLICILFFVKRWKLKKIFLCMLPFFLIIFIFLSLRLQYSSLKTSLLDKIFQADISFPVYLATFAKLIWWYVSKLIQLDQIVLIWFSLPVKENVVYWILVLGLFVAINLFCFFTYKKWPRVSFAVCWFSLGFLPVTLGSFFQAGLGLMIEPHWLFFSSLGFFIFLAVLFQNFMKTVNRKIAIITFCLLVFLYLTATREYNRLFVNEKTYTTYWLKIVPHCKSIRFWLAYAYLDEGDFEKARELFKESLNNDFVDWQIYVNLGLIEQETKNSKEALNYFLQALKINPDSAVIYNNLGTIFREQKELQKAQAAFQSAVSLNPYLMEPRLNLAGIYLEKDDLFKAEKLYLDNLAVNPKEENSFLGLTKLYLQQKEKNQAFLFARKLLRYSRNPLILVQAGSLFASQGYKKTALSFYNKALTIDPFNKDVYLELGKLYGNLGQFNQAMSAWSQGLEIDPADGRFKGLIKEAQKLIETQR